MRGLIVGASLTMAAVPALAQDYMRNVTLNVIDGCFTGNVRRLDDGISDALTIARVLKFECVKTAEQSAAEPSADYFLLLAATRVLHERVEARRAKK